MANIPFEFRQDARAFMEAFNQAVVALRKKKTSHILNEENSYRYNHGRSWVSTAATADRDPTGLNRHSAEFSTGFNDVMIGNTQVMIEAIEHIAETFSASLQRSFYEVIGASCDKHGNTIDAQAHGSPAEAFKEMMQKIQFGVGRDGSVSIPEIHAGPEAADKIRADFAKQGSDFGEELERIKAAKIEEALQRDHERRSKFLRPIDE